MRLVATFFLAGRFFVVRGLPPWPRPWLLLLGDGFLATAARVRSRSSPSRDPFRLEFIEEIGHRPTADRAVDELRRARRARQRDRGACLRHAVHRPGAPPPVCADPRARRGRPPGRRESSPTRRRAASITASAPSMLATSKTSSSTMSCTRRAPSRFPISVCARGTSRSSMANPRASCAPTDIGVQGQWRSSKTPVASRSSARSPRWPFAVMRPLTSLSTTTPSGRPRPGRRWDVLLGLEAHLELVLPAAGDRVPCRTSLAVPAWSRRMTDGNVSAGACRRYPSSAIVIAASCSECDGLVLVPRIRAPDVLPPPPLIGHPHAHDRPGARTGPAGAPSPTPIRSRAHRKRPQLWSWTRRRREADLVSPSIPT